MPGDTSLNERTTVPLTWVLGIVLTLVTGCGTVVGAYAWLDSQFDGLSERLISVESKLDTAGQDRWSRSDMLAWSSTFKAANPSIVLPPLPSKE